MNRNRMNLKLFEADANIIDRSGAESLIPSRNASSLGPQRKALSGNRVFS